MTNEEFQKLVLEKLEGLEKGQANLEAGQKKLEKRQENLEIGQEAIIKELRSISEQTADLTEFREEVKEDT